MKRRPQISTVAALVAVCLAGCKREEIRVYSVAQEIAAAPARAVDETPTPAANPSRPQLAYTLPAGWQDAGATSMSLANFRIKADAGEASVNVTLRGSQRLTGSVGGLHGSTGPAVNEIKPRNVSCTSPTPGA